MKLYQLGYILVVISCLLSFLEATSTETKKTKKTTLTKNTGNSKHSDQSASDKNSETDDDNNEESEQTGEPEDNEEPDQTQEPVPGNENTKKATAPFRFEDVELKFKDLSKVWNEKYPNNPINVKPSDSSIILENLAIEYGKTMTAEAYIEKIAGNPNVNSKKFKNLIKELTKMFGCKENIKRKADNETNGYTGSVSIYFLSSDEKTINMWLKEYFPRIYGLNGIKSDKADFYDAFKAVYGAGKELIFGNIEVDSKKTNLENLGAHLMKVPQEPIAKTETAPKLAALREAIDAYTVGKTDELLEKVKIAWLNQLKGDATLSQTETTEPVKNEDANLNQKGANLNEKGANLNEKGKNLTEGITGQLPSSLESSNSTTPTTEGEKGTKQSTQKKDSKGWIKWALIGGGAAIAAAASGIAGFFLMKKKAYGSNGIN